MSLALTQGAFRAWLATGEAKAGERLAPGVPPGLAVYLNNNRAALMGCLAASFPVTRAWLGDEAFDAACADHIERRPPSSWTLDAYALGFPKSLSARYADDPEVADLARLESALAQAFVGPDSPASEPCVPEGIRWDDAVFVLAPTLTRLSMMSNAPDLFTAISAGEEPPPAHARPACETVLVWRRGFTPVFRPASPLEAAAVQSARNGATFGEICADLALRLGPKDGCDAAGAMLGAWLAGGVVLAVRHRASPC